MLQEFRYEPGKPEACLLGGGAVRVLQDARRQRQLEGRAGVTRGEIGARECLLRAGAGGKENDLVGIGLDDDGWPHWDIVKPFTLTGVDAQERYLKELIVKYMDSL